MNAKFKDVRTLNDTPLNWKARIKTIIDGASLKQFRREKLLHLITLIAVRNLMNAARNSPPLFINTFVLGILKAQCIINLLHFSIECRRRSIWSYSSSINGDSEFVILINTDRCKRKHRWETFNCEKIEIARKYVLYLCLC